MAIHTENRGGSYLRGIADVRVRDDAELIIQFEDGDKYTVPYDMSAVGLVDDGKYRVSLSSDGSQLFGITPAAGTYIVRYAGMVASKGELPTPKLIEGGPRKTRDGKKSWNAPDYMAFTVLLRIVSANCKRMTIPYQLNYSFEQYKDTDETSIPLGTKQYERTATFLQLAGMDFNVDSIPFSENVLPYLDKLFGDKNNKFQVVLKNGYVDQAFELAPVLDSDD
jgi:hypothetical protein